MAETTKTHAQEREYVIPLRRQTMKVPAYRRSGRAVTAIKQFVAKHMKVADRDLDKVKLDVYFNNEVWLRGRANPPSKVKVKATRDGENVIVTFVEMPKRVSFLKAKNDKLHQAASTKSAPTVEAPKTDDKTPDQKTEEKEKEKSVAAAGQAQAKQDAKTAKHVSHTPEKKTQPQRMALQK
jgi:large subunit ribosomal protein L31e